jgi:tRNA wybutosine-synthesizing protein 3
MEFEKQKKDVLGREDKSIIGGIDPRILGLVNLVNSLDDYYTTSSCSGRLGLLHRIARGKNKGMEWVFKSHEPLALEAGQGVSVLRGYFNKGEELWLRQEPLILHVCCRDVECARRLMAAAQNAGFKRPGIIAAGGGL